MRASRTALAALVLANVVPLVGVAAFDWRLFDVMLLYWLENGVIGVVNLARMATAGRTPAAALWFGPFFTVHYGMFWLVHGAFVVALFAPPGAASSPFGSFAAGPGGAFGGALGPGGPVAGPSVVEPAVSALTLPMVGSVSLTAGVAWAVATIAASHAVSFVRDWWRSDERREASPATLMTRPYPRLLVLHVTLLAGGFLVMALGRPLPALVLMVVLKIGIDVAAHRREQRGAAGPAGPSPGPMRARPAARGR